MKKLQLLSLLTALSLLAPLAASATLSQERLESIFNTFQTIYNERIDHSREIIIFNPPMAGGLEWWDFDHIRSSYVQAESQEGLTEHRVIVIGGFARQPFMTVDGQALIICHELGHAFGGPPYKDNGTTTEGQSDYYATSNCLRDFFDQWPDGRTVRQRALAAIELFSTYLLETEGTHSSINERSDEVVTEINHNDRYYPPAQCRIDTLMAGLHHDLRPPCWFVD
jgi:hypothetical protein